VQGSPYVIDYRGAFDFELGPEAMWDGLEQTERFEAWWGWLHEFRLEGGALESGSVLRGVVSPPVPYEMRIRVVLDRCRKPVQIDAHIEGDLEGSAGLRLEPRGDGSRAVVWWKVEMKQRPMRIAARLAPSLMRWGHDRVVEMTLRGLPASFGYRGRAPSTGPAVGPRSH
jgi:hypothetical protein